MLPQQNVYHLGTGISLVSLALLNTQHHLLNKKDFTKIKVGTDPLSGALSWNG